MKAKHKTEKCEYCGKGYKRIKGHLVHCAAKKQRDMDRISYQNNLTRSVESGREMGARAVTETQQFRGKDAIIALTEAVAKLNQAFAQVIGEWRY